MNVKKGILDQLYNKEFKESFLDEYLEDDATRETYAIFLNQAGIWERKINKDICEFSREDILDMFSNNFTSSHTSLRTRYTVCKQYAGWATTRGLNLAGFNSFDLIKFRQHILPMLNITGLDKKYITEEELWMIANEAKNYQDVIGMVLAFYSVKGDQNIEQVYITRDDINQITNKVKLVVKIDTDTGEITEREVELPKKVIDLMMLAWGETNYKKTGKDSKCNSYLLVDTDYVLKPCVTGKKSSVDGTINWQTINKRTKDLLIEAGYEKTSINDVYNSGKIDMLKKMEKGKGEKLEFEDFQLVQLEFGDDPKNYSNLRELYNQLAISKAD